MGKDAETTALKKELEDLINKCKVQEFYCNLRIITFCNYDLCKYVNFMGSL